MNPPFWRALEEKNAYANDPGCSWCDLCRQLHVGFASQQRSPAIHRELVGRLAAHFVIISRSWTALRFSETAAGERSPPVHPPVTSIPALIRHDPKYHECQTTQTSAAPERTHNGNPARRYAAARD